MATINVTAEDILKGVPKNCRCCPVALAIERHVAWGTVVTVDRWDIGFESLTNIGNGIEAIISTPVEARNFIEDFDARMPVQPFSFSLDIPEGF